MHKCTTKAVFDYLDNIKPSDVVNIFDYGPTIKELFGLSETDTQQLLNLWLRTFSERHLARQEAKQHKPQTTYEQLELAS